MDHSKKILESAYACISEKGYATVSLRQISNHAGVALSQLHYYYGSKQSLFKAVILNLLKAYIKEFKDVVRYKENKLEALMGHLKEVLDKNPKMFRLFFDLSNLALWSESFKPLYIQLMNELEDLIAECLGDKYNVTLSKIVLATFFGMSFQYILNPESDILDSTMSLTKLI